MNLLLRPLGFLYGMGACIRRQLYSLLGLRSTVDIPAWVIGNLSVGGSGKTPLVMELVRRLSDRGMDGFSIATLSRGYGRKSRGFYRVTECNSARFGDEPSELYVTVAASCDAGVFVGEDRVEALKRLRLEGFDLALLDDGMQHLPLKAKGYILTTDFAKLPDRDYCMPAGRLREFAGCTEAVDFVVVTKCPGHLMKHDFIALRERLSGFLKIDHRNDLDKRILFVGQGLSFFEVVSTDGRLGEVLWDLDGNETGSFFAVVGVVDGEGVIAGWKGFLTIEGQAIYGDHFEFKRRHIQEWVSTMRKHGIQRFVCTRKDWMRILPFYNEFGSEIQLLVVGTRPVLLDPLDDFEFLMHEILKK